MTQSGDHTLVDPRRGPATLAETLHASDPSAARAAPATGLTGASVRSTVLPRLAYEGDIPKLVTDMRDRFETAQVLGRGGVGEVVLARDNDIERPVAVKRLLPEGIDAGLVARFVDEIRVLGALDHPNIVPVHDVGIDPDGRYYYVMKYVEGDTLEHVIERLAAGDRDYHARYTVERRVEIFQQVLQALQYAHARGIIHRDIKPANVMVGRYGEVLVMDWGIARRIHKADAVFPVSDAATTLRAHRSTGADAADDNGSTRARTVVGQLIGTPAYMAPEQARGDNDRVDERSDIYALCVMFHELLTLRHYLERHQSVAACLHGAQHEEVPFAKGFEGPHQTPVPADLAHFIRHGTSKNPAERYRTVTEMMSRLRDIEEGHCPVECPATMMKRMGTETTHAIDRRPFVLLTVAAVAVFLALFGAVALAVTLLG